MLVELHFLEKYPDSMLPAEGGEEMMVSFSAFADVLD